MKYRAYYKCVYYWVGHDAFVRNSRGTLKAVPIYFDSYEEAFASCKEKYPDCEIKVKEVKG